MIDILRYTRISPIIEGPGLPIDIKTTLRMPDFLHL